MKNLEKIYHKLLEKYGPQGWWPITSYKGNNPTKTGAVDGYHPSDYSFPRDENEKFEVCLGAILTQNTSWTSVEKALLNLKRINALSIQGITKLSDAKLREMIKPAGYYNQKAKYLREFINFFKSLQGRTPSREEVLSVKGIGEETADSIMLYAFSQPEFVVDAYTKRIFSRLGVIKERAKYSEWKTFFEKTLEANVEEFQEYHALIVEHAKRHCLKKPDCNGCILSDDCEFEEKTLRL